MDNPAPSISHDIADYSAWIKEPPNSANWIDTQKNFALFSSMEMAAFKDHFLKYQPVLEQIKYGSRLEFLPKKGEWGKEVKNPILGSQIQRLLIPEYPVDQRTYQSNVFTKIVSNPANMNTIPIVETANSLSFDDHHKRAKEHILVIPKGKYISFSHFVDFATPEEIQDLMKTVAETARKRGLDQTGYRIITNNSLNPGQQINNDAEQEIPHFHIHLAGGECLGKPVAGSGIGGKSRSELDMTISAHPFAFDWTQAEFYQYVNFHKIGERYIQGKGRKIIAYRQDNGTDVGVKTLIGFLMLDHKSRSAYTSIDDFALNATPEEMVELFKFINDVAHKVGIDQTGFRLISNFGNDAGPYPKNIMTISIAGGNMLGVTVANVYGSRRLWEGGSSVQDYIHLQAPYPHDHCSANAYDTYKLVDQYKSQIPEIFVKEDPVLNLGFVWNIKSALAKISKIKRPQDIKKIIFERLENENFSEIFKNFINVEELELRTNRFRSIPDIIFTFKKLKKLNIGDNLIESIGPEIDRLENLESLNVTSNRLNIISNHICKCVNLKEVFLAGNSDLKTLPDCFANLNKLEILYIHNTNIKVLPHNFLKLKGTLKSLMLSRDFEYAGKDGTLGKLELGKEFPEGVIKYQ